MFACGTHPDLPTFQGIPLAIALHLRLNRMWSASVQRVADIPRVSAILAQLGSKLTIVTQRIERQRTATGWAKLSRPQSRRVHAFITHHVMLEQRPESNLLIESFSNGFQ